MGLINNLKNLFGTNKYFFDKEATIKEYLKKVPPNKRRNFSDYEELYQEAVKHVGKQDFDKNTADLENYFYELTRDEKAIAVFIGIISYLVAYDVDSNGKELEKAIDDILPKGYDTNNPFDTKKGYGHRIFGHDPVTFGIKNIPGDTLIKVKIENENDLIPIRIGEFLGVGVDKNVSMWDLVWKFYGDNDHYLCGLSNAIKHCIVHFAKDLLTPMGIPIPFLNTIILLH